MPWKKLPQRKARRRIYSLALELARVMQVETFDGLSFGATIDAVFVACCVGLGHAEDRPMTATKISHYLNMPRTTVLRKLDELMQMGVGSRAGYHYLISEEHQAHSEWIARCNVAIISYAKEIAAEKTP